MKKHFHLIITIFIFGFNDLLGNSLLEYKWSGCLSNRNNNVKWFCLFLLLINFSLGAYYLKKNASILIQSIWIGTYSFIIFYFLVRCLLNVFGQLPGNFILNSHLSLGLSVFTFGIFYLINLK